jgi:aryl-alcohol dehydrogenase-like predicted oxidoreductase
MAEARAVGKKIHVRSVFLQGLFFKDEKELTGNLREFSPVIRRLQAYSTTSGASIREICLNFALHQPEIDHVIIGVETAEQLSQNIAAIAPEITRSWPRDLNLPPVDMALLNPSTWKP